MNLDLGGGKQPEADGTAQFAQVVAQLTAQDRLAAEAAERRKQAARDLKQLYGEFAGAIEKATARNRALMDSMRDGTWARQTREMQRLGKEYEKLRREAELTARYGDRIGGFLARHERLLGGARQAAGYAGAAALATGGGLVRSGFQGTVEQNRLNQEWHMLSREMANAFKPLIDVTTRGVRELRKFMEGLGGAGQNVVMFSGLALSAAATMRLVGAGGLVASGVRALASGGASLAAGAATSAGGSAIGNAVGSAGGAAVGARAAGGTRVAPTPVSPVTAPAPAPTPPASPGAVGAGAAGAAGAGATLAPAAPGIMGSGAGVAGTGLGAGPLAAIVTSAVLAQVGRAGGQSDLIKGARKRDTKEMAIGAAEYLNPSLFFSRQIGKMIAGDGKRSEVSVSGGGFDSAGSGYDRLNTAISRIEAESNPAATMDKEAVVILGELKTMLANSPFIAKVQPPPNPPLSRPGGAS